MPSTNQKLIELERRIERIEECLGIEEHEITQDDICPECDYELPHHDEDGLYGENNDKKD